MPEPLPLVIDDTFITVPCRPEVQRAIETWLLQKVAELELVLDDFDLDPRDIVMPQFHRQIYAPASETSDSKEADRG